MTSWAIRGVADLTRAVVVGATTESQHLDFKKELDKAPEWQSEVGRDVSQFANSFGGTLLLGVEERKDPLTNVKTAINIGGVKDPDDARERVELAIRNVLVPADFNRTIDFITTASGAVVVAVNVLPSTRTVWVVTNNSERLSVLRRTNHGKEYMRPGEIERIWSNTLRSAQISFHEAIDRAKAEHPHIDPIKIEIVGGIVRVRYDDALRRHEVTGVEATVASPILGGFDSRSFEIRVSLDSGPCTLRIPFELLSTAWVTSEGLVNILCSSPIVRVHPEKVVRFDPFKFFSAR